MCRRGTGVQYNLKKIFSILGCLIFDDLNVFTSTSLVVDQQGTSQQIIAIAKSEMTSSYLHLCLMQSYLWSSWSRLAEPRRRPIYLSTAGETQHSASMYRSKNFQRRKVMMTTNDYLFFF